MSNVNYTSSKQDGEMISSIIRASRSVMGAEQSIPNSRSPEIKLTLTDISSRRLSG